MTTVALNMTAETRCPRANRDGLAARSQPAGESFRTTKHIVNATEIVQCVAAAYALTMSGITEVISHERPIELRAAPSGTSFQPAEAKAQPGDDAPAVQMLFTLVTVAAVVLI